MPICDTNKTLLQRIRQNDEVSWNEFYNTYAPLIQMRGSDFHLTAAELSELVQDVMVAIFKTQSTFTYSPERGKFRNYLRKVTTNAAFKILRRRSPDSLLSETIAGDDENDVCWQHEWESYLIEEALRALRDHMESLSYQAFCLYVLEDKPPQEVAKQLAISVNAVYLAKSRGIGMLRNALSELRKNSME